jgi:hypothetical protein
MPNLRLPPFRISHPEDAFSGKYGIEPSTQLGKTKQSSAFEQFG